MASPNARPHHGRMICQSQVSSTGRLTVREAENGRGVLVTPLGHEQRSPNMPEESRTRRLAILIDADNTSPRIAAGLFEEVAKFGEANVRRIYGDFSGQRLKSWADILQQYAIAPYQQFAYTTGKNASDIALVIDAMDLLHSGRFDGFCLVASDRALTRLASRLRGPRADASGVGE